MVYLNNKIKVTVKVAAAFSCYTGLIPRVNMAPGAGSFFIAGHGDGMECNHR